MTKDLIDEIMDLFNDVLEKATTDIVDFGYKKKNYREKLIKLFEDNDKYD